MVELKTVGGEVLEVRQCYGCGQGFGSYGPEDGVCASCIREKEAREKPAELVEMEAIRAGHPAQTDFQRSLHMLMVKRPQDFLSRLNALQATWTERYRALEEIEKARAAELSSGGQLKEEEKDEGSEGLLEVLRRLRD